MSSQSASKSGGAGGAKSGKDGSSGSAGDGGHHDSMSFLGATATTVNYIVGAGLLGIPGAMVKAGLVLSPIIIVVMGVVLNFTASLMTESLARAESLAKVAHITANRLKEKVGLHESTEGDEPSAVAANPLSSSSSSTSSTSVTGALIKPTQREYLVHGRRKFEVTDQLLLFIGKHSQITYLIGLSLYMYGSLISYSVIASSSVTANVGLGFLPPGTKCDVTKQDCPAPYYFWLAVFAAIVIPFSAMEIREQIWMQVIMFLARILVMVLLAVTSAAGLSCDGVAFADVAPGTAGQGVSLADPTGLGKLIPTAIFAFIFHHSIPALSSPVKDKTSLNSIFRTALILVGCCYIALGVCVAMFFGDKVDSQCNLNWAGYVGCQPRPTTGPCADPSTWTPSCADVDGRPVWASVVAYIILLFPALDVLSAFPLNALTLGNNLMSAILGEAALTIPSDEEEDRFFNGEDAQDEEARRAVAAKHAIWRWAFVGKYKPPAPPAPAASHGHGSFVDSATRAGAAAVAVVKSSMASMGSVKKSSNAKLGHESSVPFLLKDSSEGNEGGEGKKEEEGAAAGATEGEGAAESKLADAAADASGAGAAGKGAAEGKRAMLRLNIASSASAANVIVSPSPGPRGAVAAAKQGNNKGSINAAAAASAPAGVGKVRTPLASRSVFGGSKSKGGKAAGVSLTEGDEAAATPLSPADTEDDVVDITRLDELDDDDDGSDGGDTVSEGDEDAAEVEGEDGAVAAAAAGEAPAAAKSSAKLKRRRTRNRNHHHHHHHGPVRPLCMRTRRGFRTVTTLFRMLAAIPPICIAFAVDDLGNVLQFTGLVGVAIAFTVPAALSIYSLAKERAIYSALSAYLLKRFGSDYLSNLKTKATQQQAQEAQRGLDALVASLPSASAVLGAIEAKSAGMQEDGLLTPPPKPLANGTVAAVATATGAGAAIVTPTSSSTSNNTATASASASSGAIYASTAGLEGNGGSNANAAVASTGSVVGEGNGSLFPVMDEQQLVPLGAAALKASALALSFKEALNRVKPMSPLLPAVDALYWKTPYTPGYKCRRAAEWVLGGSVVIAIFVLVMIILSYVNGD